MRYRIDVVALALVCCGSAAAQDLPRARDGKPDLNGIWQTFGEANWNLEPHAAHAGAVETLGAIGAVPPSVGVVETAMHVPGFAWSRTEFAQPPGKPWSASTPSTAGVGPSGSSRVRGPSAKPGLASWDDWNVSRDESTQARDMHDIAFFLGTGPDERDVRVSSAGSDPVRGIPSEPRKLASEEVAPGSVIRGLATLDSARHVGGNDPLGGRAPWSTPRRRRTSPPRST